MEWPFGNIKQDLVLKEFLTRGLKNVNVCLVHMTLCVFIIFGVLVHQANAAFYELCHQPLCCLLFTLIRLFNGEYALFIEQFYE